jgi:endonuclease YncB( thermonuclease family)
MSHRSLIRLVVVAGFLTILYAKDPDWQSGDVASMDVIRTPIGKKIMYRYSYAVHANGHTFTFDETKKLPLTIHGPVRFAVDGDKLRVFDERGKEHKETVLQKAIDK